MPPAPEIDGVSAEILGAYHCISRGRQYIGMIGQPAALSHRDIDAYLQRFPTAIPLEEFEAAIFALDDEYRDQWEAQNAEKTTSKK